MKPVPPIEWYGPSPPWAPAEVQAREREDAARRSVLAPQPMTPAQVANLVARVRAVCKSRVRSVLSQLASPHVSHESAEEDPVDMAAWRAP